MFSLSIYLRLCFCLSVRSGVGKILNFWKPTASKRRDSTCRVGHLGASPPRAALILFPGSPQLLKLSVPGGYCPYVHLYYHPAVSRHLLNYNFNAQRWFHLCKKKEPLCLIKLAWHYSAVWRLHLGMLEESRELRGLEAYVCTEEGRHQVVLLCVYCSFSEQ